MNNEIPSEAPPSYQQATGPPHAASNATPTSATSGHLEVPGSHSNGIPEAYRRSMEDEGRPLPEGWVRTFDPVEEHQFFVDTTKDPPRSSWVHPYDNDEYLATLSSEERERLEEEHYNRGQRQSKADIISAHTDDEDDDHSGASSSRIPNELPPRDGKGKANANDGRSFGRKFKDKVTGMTHEEREKERAQRARREQQLYERHLQIRQAMARAAQTGQPQLVGKDNEGRDIYIEPPAYRGGMGMGGMGGMVGMGGGGRGGYPGRGYAMDPYGGGIYTTPNARYIRPQNPYMRPRGMGYGGGYGLPLMMGGGLLGGMMLGDAMF